MPASLIPLAFIVLLPLTQTGPTQTVEVPLLFGIASVVVKSDSIDVVKDDALPEGLELRKDSAVRDKATIKVGESFLVGDGHHLGHSFKLLAVKGGTARLEETFWTAFLGMKPTQSTSEMEVRSYVVKKKKRGPAV